MIPLAGGLRACSSLPTLGGMHLEDRLRAIEASVRSVEENISLRLGRLERIFVLVDWNLLERAIDEQLKVPVHLEPCLRNSPIKVAEYDIQSSLGQQKVDEFPDLHPYPDLVRLEKIAEEVGKLPPKTTLDQLGLESQVKFLEDASSDSEVAKAAVAGLVAWAHCHVPAQCEVHFGEGGGILTIDPTVDMIGSFVKILPFADRSSKSRYIGKFGTIVEVNFHEKDINKEHPWCCVNVPEFDRGVKGKWYAQDRLEVVQKHD